MKYKTELHCHNKEVSPCADADSAFIVDIMLSHGYSTVVLTNHLHPWPFQFRHLEDISWEEKTKFYFDGYRALKSAAGDKLNVIAGAEISFAGTSEDYLLYGFTEEFMLAHPNCYDMAMADFVPLAREAGILTVQAHPFRPNLHRADTALLDGVEVFNGHPGQNSHNDLAEEFANTDARLIKTSGTDFHDILHVPNSGIITERPIKTSEELICVLKSGNYKLIRNDA